MNKPIAVEEVPNVFVQVHWGDQKWDLGTRIPVNISDAEIEGWSLTVGEAIKRLLIKLRDQSPGNDASAILEKQISD